MEKDIQKKIKEIISLMGFDEVKIEVLSNEDDSYLANLITSPEISGMLIGHHGEVIDALQLVVNLFVNVNNQEWIRTTININDYREQRKEIVTNMTLNASQNAKTTGKEVILNYLPSHERRIAHMVLSEDNQVETYSEGSGKYRRLVISPIASQEA